MNYLERLPEFNLTDYPYGYYMFKVEGNDKQIEDAARKLEDVKFTIFKKNELTAFVFGSKELADASQKLLSKGN